MLAYGTCKSIKIGQCWSRCTAGHRCDLLVQSTSACKVFCRPPPQSLRSLENQFASASHSLNAPITMLMLGYTCCCCADDGQSPTAWTAAAGSTATAAAPHTPTPHTRRRCSPCCCCRRAAVRARHSSLLLAWCCCLCLSCLGQAANTNQLLVCPLHVALQSSCSNTLTQSDSTAAARNRRLLLLLLLTQLPLPQEQAQLGAQP